MIFPLNAKHVLGIFEHSFRIVDATMIKKNVFTLALIICSFVLVPILFAQDASRVFVEDLNGNVQIIKAGQTQGQAAARGTVLSPDDKIQTGEKASAKIRVEGSGELTLNDHTTWSYKTYLKEKDKTTFSAHLAIGRLKAQVQKLPKGSVFEIKTPTSIAAIRGTFFDLFVYILAQHYFTQLDVFENSVAFSNLAGDRVQVVNEGQSSVGNEAGAITPPKPIGSKKDQKDENKASGNPPGGGGDSSGGGSDSGASNFPSTDNFFDFDSLMGSHDSASSNPPPVASSLPGQKKFIGESSDSDSSTKSEQGGSH